MVAPVCHIPPAVTVTPQPPGRLLPSIPNAYDLASALRAIAALRQAVQILTNQNTTDNGVINNFNTRRDQTGTWNEERRVTETVRVFNPEDDSQYVDVERINSLRMLNKDTKQTWIWNR